MTSNSLVTVNKATEQAVQLHPLVLLTISDYIARHTLREQEGPLVGAIIGTQHGRDITMEHAFECKLQAGSDGTVLVDGEWFEDRLQQHKDVHKAQQLDLVGWYTLAPPSGPQYEHLPIHRQLAEVYNESLLFLAFHPTPLLEKAAHGDKLPLTIYEPVFEAGQDDGDKHMSASGEPASTVLRFKELPYSIETGDAEMIGVDFVAKGSANATALPAAVKVQSEGESSTAKAKSKQKDESAEDAQPMSYLTNEEEDLIASMKAKANAILMLKQRLSLIRKYLESLPPCYLNDASVTTCEAHPGVSHAILRSISALLARLPLLVPYTPVSTAASGNANGHGEKALGTVYEKESMSQASDVALISLLGSLGTALESAQTMSKKAAVVETAANNAGRGKSTMPSFYDFDSTQAGPDQALGDAMEATG